MFTSLHRLLGLEPGPLTSEMVDDAVSQGIAECVDLDWKAALPQQKELANSDFKKDVAAFANSGGGTLVYGVKEEQKKAVERCGIGTDFRVDENYLRTLNAVAVSGIHPPVFGVKAEILGEGSEQTVAVIVPASVDGPHMIYRGEYFGAPVRNDFDTVWMRERDIETSYRARFEERRNSHDALDSLYEESAFACNSEERAWFIAVAIPRLANIQGPRPTRQDAEGVLTEAKKNTLFYSGRGSVHPFESTDSLNPRPGYRRWNANCFQQQRGSWGEAWIGLHHNGSVSLTFAIGGPRKQDGHEKKNIIDSTTLESAVSDFMGLIKAQADKYSLGEFEIRVGIELQLDEPIIMLSRDAMFTNMLTGSYSTPIQRFVPIYTAVRADVEPLEFKMRTYELAEDCINQAGLSAVHTIDKPEQNG